MIRHLLLSLLALSVCLPMPLYANELCFFDDFNHHPPGDFPRERGPWRLNRTGDAAWTVEIVKDQQNRFGSSTRNRFLCFRSDADKGPTLAAAEVIPNLNVVTISFSTVLQAGEWPLRIYIGRGPSSGDALSMLASISARETSGPVVHRFDLIVNHTAQPVVYGNEGRSLAPRSMDLWRDGVLIAESVKSPGKLPLEEPLDTFVFRTSTGGEGKPLEAWIDWVAVFDGPTVGGDISRAATTHPNH